MTMPGAMPTPPKDVQTVESLGAATQNLNPTKVKATSQGRMSSGFLGSTGGLTSGLVTTATNLFGGFIGDIVDDTSGTTVESPQDVSDQVGGFFGSPVSKLFDGILSLFSPILQGLTDGLTGAAGFLAGLFSLKWDQVDQSTTDITDLQDKTQALQDVIGYGCSYMHSTQNIDVFNTKKKMMFSTQVGPIVGCTLADGGFTLNSKGLWEVQTQMTYNFYIVGDKSIDLDVRVYTPGGSLYFEKLYHDKTGERVTRSNVCQFVVPAAGYKVFVYANCAVARGILGGVSLTGLRVSKISGETS